ncbi:MAG: MoxR family ATPase, partial [Gammaproteobacteria bacterium]|nr:MoxR family ATPase [Gammaproteobacteria bacterium]
LRKSQVRSMQDTPDAVLQNVQRQIIGLENEVRKRIVGMNEEMRLALICLFAGGHVLLEGVPGLAKTLFFKTLAEAAHVQFRRISFAADLLPKDVIGIEHFDPATGKVSLVVKGPLHTNFLLTDELNRARTSSKGSVLEPMEEGQVTTELGGTYKLSPLFMVIATQNPVEEEGTFGLGRAERDRFLMKIPIGYPSPDEEQEIIRRYGTSSHAPEVNQVISADSILADRQAIETHVHVEEPIIDKVQRILDETRPERTTLPNVTQLIERGGGASPRAGIGIIYAARVNAVMQGRDHVTPHDLVAVVTPILRHRLVFKHGEVREEESEQRLTEIIDEVVHRVM